MLGALIRTLPVAHARSPSGHGGLNQRVLRQPPRFEVSVKVGHLQGFCERLRRAQLRKSWHHPRAVPIVALPRHIMALKEGKMGFLRKARIREIIIQHARARAAHHELAVGVGARGRGGMPRIKKRKAGGKGGCCVGGIQGGLCVRGWLSEDAVRTREAWW